MAICAPFLTARVIPGQRGSSSRKLAHPKLKASTTSAFALLVFMDIFRNKTRLPLQPIVIQQGDTRRDSRPEQDSSNRCLSQE